MSERENMDGNGTGNPAARIVERWMEVAERASKEQDPVKLLALIKELNALLAKKERSLGSALAEGNDGAGGENQDWPRK